MLPLKEQQRDLIERIGVLHDQSGLRPAEGRILGLLIAASEPELTFDEIRASLDLSKSATSNALNRLQTIGTVEYRTHPGDRKRYFKKSYVNWERAFINRGVKYLEIRHLLIEALEYRDKEIDGTRQSMEEMIDFLQMLEESMLDAYDRWQKKRNRRGK
jgi:DNA-binding transcriptional regulator GbsR (MarR family)